MTDNMQRSSSRTIYNSDAIDCIVNTNDLALEHDTMNQEFEQKRASSDSRRHQPSKRINGHSTDRSSRHSPPLVTHKRPSSPSTNSLSTSRSQHNYYVSQKYQEVSRSPSPTSRHHRSSRVAASVKRPHSDSRSPHERRPTTHRTYPTSSRKRTNNIDEFQSTPSVRKQTGSTKTHRKQELGDLSIVSEDELTKPHDNQSNNSTTNELSSSTTNKLHSTPSVPILQPTSNESLLEMSTIPQDCEISLFAKSALSITNTSSISTTPIIPGNDFMQIIDLMSRYKMMQAIPSTNKEIEVCSKEIFVLIQKQIELQKKELDYREREMKLRERELIEREKCFNEKLNTSKNLISNTNEPIVTFKPTIIEEKSSQQEFKITIDQNTKNVMQEKTVEQSIPTTVDTSKIDLGNKNTSNQSSSSSIRKNHGKSRFSQIIDEPSSSTLQKQPIIDPYSDIDIDNQSCSSINSTNSLKKVLSNILASSESTKSIMDGDLKVTSTNSCRKVEIQSDNIHPTITISKEPPQDLRLTLSKNRTKHQNNDDNNTHDQVINRDEQIVTMSAINEDKQQSHDYPQQRSVTSASIGTIIDESNDKRDDHRHHHHQQQRSNSSRQQQYPGDNYSASTNERSYYNRSTSQQSAKNEANQKRHETDDLRTHIYEQKYSKPPKNVQLKSQIETYEKDSIRLPTKMLPFKIMRNSSRDVDDVQRKNDALTQKVHTQEEEFRLQNETMMHELNEVNK
ncbi:unnamed protein product [Adineta steineri]|uniref:Uncharacterized protein n=1 Tax=Adineta steineri TaxID=433720 RepID=A0A815I7S3_9BILA|nr:unnamed protein product [Adineta steineri]CAF3815249.1 unnamed protein product [Adineta steineri]